MKNFLKRILCCHSWERITEADWLFKVRTKYGSKIHLSLNYLHISNIGYIPYECVKCRKIVVKSPDEIMFREINQ